MSSSSQFAEASIRRICDHMNEDHSDALSYYLQYYASIKVPPKDSLMTHIDKDGMDIEILGQKDKTVVRVPFDPPLKDAKEARTRLIHMAWAAVEGLGMSRYQVDRYTFTFVQGLLICTCLLMYWIFLTPKPISPIEPFLRKHIPRTFQIIFMMMPPVLHALETQLLMIPLLRKHRVPTKVRVKWVLACLASGGPAVKAFNDLVREEKQKLDNQTKDM